MAQASSDWGPPDDPQFTYQNEKYVAGAATLLFQQGKTESARLLLEVTGCSWKFYFEEAPTAILEVPVWAMDSFTPERRAEIAQALCSTAGRREDVWPDAVEPIPQLPGADWKPHLKKMMDVGSKNQARLVPLKAKFPTADGMAFRDNAELRVYEALKAKQEALPADDTFTVVPNASVRVPGRTWEPDFLIGYKGRCCVIEVDGGSHNRKYASDKSRDELLQDAGIAFVKRIDRADAMNDPDLYEFIVRTLRKLANT